MKKLRLYSNSFSLLFVVAGIFVLFSGMSSKDGPALIRIEKNALFFDEHELSKSWKVDSLQSYIGKPDTMTGTGHPSAMYDHFRIGIRYWQEEAKEIGVYAEDIKVYITDRQEDDAKDKHAAFGGLIVLDGVPLDSTLSADDLRKKLKGWRECSAFSGAIQFMTRDIFIFAGFGKNYSELQWVAFGKITSIIGSCD